jgi:hypothetical protein
VLGGLLNRVSSKKGGYTYYHHYYSQNGHGSPAPPAKSDQRRQGAPFAK